jgi:hypothetical protein
MIETFMAEVRAICSRGWSIALLALACCAAEADVLSSGENRGREPFPLGGGVDAGVAFADAASDLADASDGAWHELYPALDAGALIWSVCQTASILERGRTGDSCTFLGGCALPLANCTWRTALCVNGELYTNEVSKSVCVGDDLGNTRRCAAAVPDTCCVELWQCDDMSQELAPGQPVARVCALDCPKAMPATGGDVFAGCPDDPSGPPWPPGAFPPPKGTPCRGDFVCDSLGRSAGPGTEPFTFDEFGRIYWCQHGLLQRAATGRTLPWNTVALPSN